MVLRLQRPEAQTSARRLLRQGPSGGGRREKRASETGSGRKATDRLGEARAEGQGGRAFPQGAGDGELEAPADAGCCGRGRRRPPQHGTRPHRRAAPQRGRWGRSKAELAQRWVANPPETPCRHAHGGHRTILWTEADRRLGNGAAFWVRTAGTTMEGPVLNWERGAYKSCA